MGAGFYSLSVASTCDCQIQSEIEGGIHMTPEQFEALEAWISDMIHPENNDVRASYLKARKLLVVEAPKEIEQPLACAVKFESKTGCFHSTGWHRGRIDEAKVWSCCGEPVIP
jgi:hypothetical protein